MEMWLSSGNWRHCFFFSAVSLAAGLIPSLCHSDFTSMPPQKGLLLVENLYSEADLNYLSATFMFFKGNLTALD